MADDWADREAGKIVSQFSVLFRPDVDVVALGYGLKASIAGSLRAAAGGVKSDVDAAVARFVADIAAIR